RQVLVERGTSGEVLPGATDPLKRHSPVEQRLHDPERDEVAEGVQARHPGAPAGLLHRGLDEADLVPVPELTRRARRELAGLVRSEPLHRTRAPRTSPHSPNTCIRQPVEGRLDVRETVTPSGKVTSFTPRRHPWQARWTLRVADPRVKDGPAILSPRRAGWGPGSGPRGARGSTRSRSGPTAGGRGPAPCRAASGNGRRAGRRPASRRTLRPRSRARPGTASASRTRPGTRARPTGCGGPGGCTGRSGTRPPRGEGPPRRGVSRSRPGCAVRGRKEASAPAFEPRSQL